MRYEIHLFGIDALLVSEMMNKLYEVYTNLKIFRHVFTFGLEERIAAISAGEGVNRKRVILTSYGQEEECEINNKTKQNKNKKMVIFPS